MMPKKNVLIKGDMNELNLGLSEEDRERIKDINVIFHSAAFVNFADNIRLLVNIKGTKNLLLLAQEMPNLRAFVHVSTAYSQCINKNIEEKFYKPLLKTEDIINLTEILSEEQLDIITPNLIGKWPNSYIWGISYQIGHFFTSTS
ncbi:fatty acyl-CoA reductase 2-like [Polistes fuscatus]|uniref:fatty acyl-CoA reductase 2-like n=1 Tax=Polistes fuscatus TaxID=30207 RepID=UPI001CA88FBA|nr:fatty acyl-CoA reductase 2-like [Polistes fuscatus]